MVFVISLRKLQSYALALLPYLFTLNGRIAKVFASIKLVPTFMAFSYILYVQGPSNLHPLLHLLISSLYSLTRLAVVAPAAWFPNFNFAQLYRERLAELVGSADFPEINVPSSCFSLIVPIAHCGARGRW